MINLLQKYLNKIGVKDYSELNQDEKDTFKSWEEALSGKKITDEDVAMFFVKEENDILDKLTNEKNKEDREFLLAELKVIRKVKSFLATPQVQKKIAEISINNLLQHDTQS